MNHVWQLQEAKSKFSQVIDLAIDEGLALEAKLFGECCDTGDFKEGTGAFLEKRPAKFMGH